METNSTIATLHHLLDYDARKFTCGEILLKKQLPDWINRASSLQLKQVLQKYQGLVQQHVQKMDAFITEENFTSLCLNNRVMQAFLEEANEKLIACSDAEVRDACLLACIQDINHYKISTYGTAAAFAQTIGLQSSSAIFHELEINEKNIDDRLSQLAAYEINRRANAPIVLPE